MILRTEPKLNVCVSLVSIRCVMVPYRIASDDLLNILMQENVFDEECRRQAYCICVYSVCSMCMCYVLDISNEKCRKCICV